MLLQTRNITLAPRGVNVGFVVVLLLPEKVKPFGPLEISQNRVFESVKFCDFVSFSTVHMGGIGAKKVM